MISSHLRFNILVLSSVNHFELSTIPNSNKNGHIWSLERISLYHNVYPPDFCVYSRSEKQMALLGVAGAIMKVAAICGSLLKGSYNRGLIRSAPLKNAMDWGSRPPNVWGGKATGIVSARGLLGGARGQFHLRQIGIFIDLYFLNKPEFFLNAFQPPPKFNPLNGDLIDEDAKLRLKQMLLSLKTFTLQLHHNN